MHGLSTIRNLNASKEDIAKLNVKYDQRNRDRALRNAMSNAKFMWYVKAAFSTLAAILLFTFAYVMI